MLTMCNVITEYKEFWCTKNAIIFFVSHKDEILFIYFTRDSIFAAMWQQNYITMT